MRYVIITLISLLLSFNYAQCEDLKETARMKEAASEPDADDSVFADVEEPAYTETVIGETTMNGLIIKDCSITADYRPNPTGHRIPYLSASIRYPQVSGMEDKSIEKKVNKLLKLPTLKMGFAP